MCESLYFVYIFSLYILFIEVYIIRDIDIRSKHKVKTI